MRANRVPDYSGFTLLEVMVAAVIMGMAATALLSLLSTSLSNLRAIEDAHHYQLAGEEVMNRVLLLSKLPPGGSAEGDLERANARWLVSVKPWIPDNLDNTPSEAVMKIDVRIEWPGRSGRRSLSLESVKGASLSYSGYDFQGAIEAALPD